MRIRVGHSPDPDDAFMYWALTTDLVDTRGHDFEQVLGDIQTLNQWARAAMLEVTAISLAAYPFVQEDYALLPHGASIGSGYGPVVVARTAVSRDELTRLEIVIPGAMTTAFLALRLVLGDCAVRELPFDEIPEEVASGRAEAGLLIHEGQLTFEDYGLVKALDLGEWWLLETGLPLPLGVNVVRRDLGEEVLCDVSAVLRDAIQCGLDNRAEALEYALAVRPRDRRRGRRPLRLDVRERADAGLRRRGAQGGHRAAPPRRGAGRVPRARPPRLRRANVAPCRAPSSSRPSARPSGATAARSRVFGPDDLAAVAIAAAVERSGVDGAAIDDVYFGCANQAGEDNRNVARMAALLAGLPDSVAGITLNRLCASGLSAVVSASHAVMAGDVEIAVAGGVESMSRAPLVTAKAETAFPRGDRTLWDTTLGWRFPNPRLEELFPLESMGETGENVAERYGVSREDQDAFAARSQERWSAAQLGEPVRGRARPRRRRRGRRASASPDDDCRARGTSSRRSARAAR